MRINWNKLCGYAFFGEGITIVIVSETKPMMFFGLFFLLVGCFSLSIEKDK